MKILIIGGGFAGCSSAEILSHTKNTKITIVEKAGFLGAGVRPFFMVVILIHLVHGIF